MPGKIDWHLAKHPISVFESESYCPSSVPVLGYFQSEQYPAGDSSMKWTPGGEPGVVDVVVDSSGAGVDVLEVKPQDSGQHACITRMYIGVEGGIEQKYGVAATWPF